MPSSGFQGYFILQNHDHITPITMEGFDFNEHVQENAGFYGAAAGISHLRNQQSQNRELQKQRKALEQQVEAAKNKAKTE